MDLKVGEQVWRVQFDDWMFLMDGQVLLNKSAMSKWGFHLGDVTLSFTRPTPLA
jgi:NOL1/NOP2/fmu family ribosome biogenesis protein